MIPPKASGDEDRSSQGVVQATDRFRDLVRARPWRRRRRTIILSVVGALVLVLGLFVAAVTLPQLKVHSIEVEGAGYVDAAAVQSAAGSAREGSVLLTRTDRLETEVEAIPGVETATVTRRWPDALTVRITEAEPVATLRTAGGTTVVLDAEGTELPSSAGKDADLAALAVDPGAKDPAAARSAMLEVVASLPADMRRQVKDMKAGTASDVSFTIERAEGGPKTVVWGDAADSTLKADVVRALLDAPGKVIDVSSPIAPVTR